MSRRFIAILALIVLAALGLAVTQPWLYFVNRVVDEKFPGLTREQRDAVDAMPDNEKQALMDMADENSDMAARQAVSMLEEPAVVPDDQQAMMPEMLQNPRELAAGPFNHIDPIHGADGVAKLFVFDDGRRFLRFEGFRSKNGPDLHVYLSREFPTTTFGSLGESPLHLGALKGNIGSQNYEIPADAELGAFQSVVIYCRPFKVIFSSAPLAYG